MARGFRTPQQLAETRALQVSPLWGASLGYVLGGFEVWKAYLYPPSSCPADILLPIREKDLTYRLGCIAIGFLRPKIIHTPMSFVKGEI